MSNNQRSRAAIVILLAITVMSSGCSVTRRGTIRDAYPKATMRLASKRPIQIEPLIPRRRANADPCLAYELQGRVTRIAGDTVHLSKFTRIRAASSVSACTWSGDAYVLMSRSPDLVWGWREHSGPRTFSILLAFASAAFAFWVLLHPLAALLWYS